VAGGIESSIRVVDGYPITNRAFSSLSRDSSIHINSGILTARKIAGIAFGTMFGSGYPLNS
jgi:hypothetical protein